MNILIISQNSSHSKSLHRQIVGKVNDIYDGIEVLTLSTPAEFNDQYDKSELDIVITDIVMSGKNGLDIISETKLSHPNITIIAISETVGIPGKFHYMPIARMLGADAALEKPINTKHFVDTVSALIELKLGRMVA